MVVKKTAKKTTKKASSKKKTAVRKEEPKEVKAPEKEVKIEEPKEAPKKPEKEAPKEKPKRTKKKAPKRKETRAFVARGKRKESVARATIRKGNGTIRLNSQNVASMSNPYIREIITEPIKYVGPEAIEVDISVNVRGGGSMGQAQAARTAIANALVMYFDKLSLRQKFIEIDRSLVVEDTRRVEPKKYRGPKARARFQKSYR